MEPVGPGQAFMLLGKKSPNPPTRVSTLEAGMGAIAVLIVSMLGAGVAIGAGFLRYDAAFVRTVSDHGTDGLTAIAYGVSHLGDTQVVFALTFVLAVAALFLGRWRVALALPASVLATQAVVQAIKLIVERGRPPQADAVVHAAGYAFPSAHAASSMALYGVLAVAALYYLRGRVQAWACGTICLLVLAIGATRVYLGAHYPTDVLAGWLVGALVAYAAWRLTGAVRTPRPA